MDSESSITNIFSPAFTGAAANVWAIKGSLLRRTRTVGPRDSGGGRSLDRDPALLKAVGLAAPFSLPRPSPFALSLSRWLGVGALTWETREPFRTCACASASGTLIGSGRYGKAIQNEDPCRPS
jgi:hypothetical protein